ncbi:MAG: hypothetical protein IT336_03570 [Thermomicrobiales bacterium]|nr:hypothetical protein [Thermomicrobiales bacterium]
MYEDIFADGIDGVHGLRRRARTRLWYRALPPVESIADHLRVAIEHAPHLAVTAPDLVDAVRVHPIHNDFTDLLVGEWPSEEIDGDSVIAEQPALSTEERQTRMLRRLGSQHDIAPVPADPVVGDLPEPMTDWRIVPRNAPTLLLASSALLDGRRPGPILAPGAKYRVLSAEDGVVGLEVMDGEGNSAAGYCNAVDLTCIEPMVVSLANGRAKTTTKQRLSRIGRGFSNVTGSLSGFIS